MKVLVGLSVFFLMSGLTFFLAGTQRIHAFVTSVMLVFSLLSGFVIANYDWLERLRFEVPGLQIFEDEVARIREDVAKDIRLETERQKTELASLAAHQEELSARLESQKKSMEALLESIHSAERELKDREQMVKEGIARVEQTRDQIVAIRNESAELALMLTKLIWLQSQADGRPDPERAEAALRQVMDGLDAVVGLVIPDPQARSEFITGVMSSLPPPRQ
jgi:septal ring factor EnvC (AmiA/AmiB activator)